MAPNQHSGLTHYTYFEFILSHWHVDMIESTIFCLFICCYFHGGVKPSKGTSSLDFRCRVTSIWTWVQLWPVKIFHGYFVVVYIVCCLFVFFLLFHRGSISLLCSNRVILQNNFFVCVCLVWFCVVSHDTFCCWDKKIWLLKKKINFRTYAVVFFLADYWLIVQDKKNCFHYENEKSVLSVTQLLSALAEGELCFSFFFLNLIFGSDKNIGTRSFSEAHCIIKWLYKGHVVQTCVVLTYFWNHLKLKVNDYTKQKIIIVLY